MPEGIKPGRFTRASLDANLYAINEALEELIAGGGGGGGAPTNAEYLVGTSDATLTAERVVTDTATITWDLSTAGQAKANFAGSTGAPTTADYLVKTADAGLSAERVVTDTSTVTWDWGTAGQAKANVVSAPVTGGQLFAHDFLLMGG